MVSTRPLIPRALLLGNPTQVMPQISPDGRLLSYVAPLDGVLNIWVAPIEDLTQAMPVTGDRKRGIRSYGWAHTGSHLWYLQDIGGDENFHLYSVDIQGGEALDLTPCTAIQARVIGFSRKFQREALVGINDRDSGWHDVYRVDIVSGERHLLQENAGFAQFLCDDELRLRMAIRNTSDGGRDILVPGESGSWRDLLHIPREDVITTTPVAMGDPGGNIAYLLDSRGRDTAAAATLDLLSGEVVLLGGHPKTDVLHIEINPLTRHAEAYRTDYLRPEWTVLDPSVAEDYRRLAEYGDFRIAGRSDDDRIWVVAWSGDDNPGRYYLYERATGKMTFLFAARPDLEGWALAHMRSIAIPTRDGLDLVSYLTLPADRPDKADRPLPALPMVLLVHGGPWSRDVFGYNAEHQFWASRGYAVLSVNFRGSTGFGKAFVNAGDREWGGRMHDDLLDAVDWAVEQGIADRDRIAIMGGSYGGYAALVGLSFTPNVFACGIDIVGPSNLETLLASFPPYWAPLLETFARRTGDPRTEEGRNLLRGRSPLHRCGDIVKPLLIAQGTNDVRVTRAESDQIVGVMKRQGKPVTYVLYPDEGHGFARPENRLSFMATAEAFLAAFLGGERQEFEDELDGSSMRVIEGAEFIPGLCQAVSKRIAD